MSIRISIVKTTGTVILPHWGQWLISFQLLLLTILQRFNVCLSMTPFPGSLSQRDYENHHVVPVASHLFIAKHARTGRYTQNGLGGISRFNPDLQSDLLLLVTLDPAILRIPSQCRLIIQPKSLNSFILL